MNVGNLILAILTLLVHTHAYAVDDSRLLTNDKAMVIVNRIAAELISSGFQDSPYVGFEFELDENSIRYSDDLSFADQATEILEKPLFSFSGALMHLFGGGFLGQMYYVNANFSGSANFADGSSQQIRGKLPLEVVVAKASGADKTCVHRSSVLGELKYGFYSVNEASISIEWETENSVEEKIEDDDLCY